MRESLDYTNSAIVTYVLLALIIAAGSYQARQMPEDGISIAVGDVSETSGQTEDPHFCRIFTGNVYLALHWLPLRFFIGREWSAAGE